MVRTPTQARDLPRFISAPYIGDVGQPSRWRRRHCGAAASVAVSRITPPRSCAGRLRWRPFCWPLTRVSDCARVQRSPPLRGVNVHPPARFARCMVARCYRRLEWCARAVLQDVKAGTLAITGPGRRSGCEPPGLAQTASTVQTRCARRVAAARSDAPLPDAIRPSDRAVAGVDQPPLQRGLSDSRSRRGSREVHAAAAEGATQPGLTARCPSTLHQWGRARLAGARPGGNNASASKLAACKGCRAMLSAPGSRAPHTPVLAALSWR